MIKVSDSVVNRYCYVCGYVHENKEDYRICDYCLQHKRWVSLPKPVYYRYGFAKRLVPICEDCNTYLFECLKVKPRIITVPTLISAFESICKVIKTSGENNPINYYETVSMAYLESDELREYLAPDVTDIKQVDKNLKTLWPFTYRIVNESQDMIQVTDKNPNNLLIKWIPDALILGKHVDQIRS